MPATISSSSTDKVPDPKTAPNTTALPVPATANSAATLVLIQALLRANMSDKEELYDYALDLVFKYGTQKAAEAA